MEESRAVDADDSDDASDNDSSSSDSEDDEEAELARELERVRREREEKKKKEEAERTKAEDEARERDIALGNPLLNKPDFTMKRRWDDDVVFKNQARGTEEKGKKKEFVNVSIEWSLPLFCALLCLCYVFSFARYRRGVFSRAVLLEGPIGVYVKVKDANRIVGLAAIRFS